MNDEVENLRKRINKINSKIVGLLDERIDVAKKIGEIKKSKGLEIFDASREAKILEEISSKSKYPENMKELFQKIMDESKKVQRDL